MGYDIELQCGTLTIESQREAFDLEQLLDFASRSNPKRGFLFVSKVLGKHIPCRPSCMRNIYRQLAEKIGHSLEPTLVIGMAETATGLGAGVADSLSDLGIGQVISQHSTRHRLDCPLLITFDEAHSHAPDQLLFEPYSKLWSTYLKAQRIVLVDDEITTGRTLKELGVALLKKLHDLSGTEHIKELVFASIVSWLTPEQQSTLQNLVPVPIRFITLLEGSFQFTPNPNFRPSLPGRIQAQGTTHMIRGDLGRRGLLLKQSSLTFDFDHDQLDPRRPVSILGTGELAFHSFLIAEDLERQGFDVYYHSTTRSPVLIGDAIKRTLTFMDEHGEGVTNYLHNPPSSNHQVRVIYETEHSAASHDLKQYLEFKPYILPSCLN